MSETTKKEPTKPMIITIDGHEYTLEFNRSSVKKTEAAGFDINQISTKPMTMVPLLFWGAFQWHHKNIKQDVTDKILFEDLGGLTEDELGHLGELFAVPFDTLVAKEEEGMAVNPRKATVKF